MVNVSKFYEALRHHGVDLFTGVPDSLLKEFCAFLADNIDVRHNIIAANEGSAVGIAAGHYLATGKLPLVYMQNSGIGNAVNPLLSLADEKVYSIPVLLIIGWRGEPGVHDEPQHVKQGEVTLSLLDAMQIPYIVLSETDDDALYQVNKVACECIEKSKPHAIVIRKGTFEKYKLKNEVVNNYPVSREEALKIVVENLGEEDIIVSTTGKLSRELFELREALGQGHERDFLTVGSMGHSSSIALGIALEKPKRRVWCFDGDGSFIMHTGAITNIGNLCPENYVHVVFNNGAHESVGGQPSLGFKIDMLTIAKAVGYKNTYAASSKNEMEKILSYISDEEGPVFIELKVGINSRDSLGRPTTTPIENKNAFIRNLNK